MYRECIDCAKLGKVCDGPNFIAMTAHEIVEWCKLRKAHLRWTNQKLADMADMPKGTIDRLMAAGTDVDFKYITIRPIVKALIGGEWHGQPCPDPDAGSSEDVIAKMQNEIDTLQAALEDEKRGRISIIDQFRQDADKKVHYLVEEIKELKTALKRSRIAAFVLAAIFAVITVIDVLSPAFGWLRY